MNLRTESDSPSPVSPRRRRLALHAVAVVAALLLAAPGARALSLADLVAGASFSSPDGILTFSDFVVDLPASIAGASNALASVDLAIFEVDVFESSFGFRVLEFDAPLVAAGDQVGGLRIDYTVTADPSQLVAGAGLSFTGTALGTGSTARVVQTISGGGTDTVLTVSRTGGGLQQPVQNRVLDTPSGQVLVSTEIFLDTRGPGLLAQISEFEQHYGTVPIPEPGAAAIFALSLVLVRARSGRLRA